MKRLPPLNTLRAFVAAARFESFNQAARQLSVTPSAVSHQIRTLETFLGVELFRRRSRQVHLTEAGQKFLPPIRDALDQIGNAAAELEHSSDQSRPLVVSTAPPFAVGWLVPRLPEFYENFPEIDIRLDTSLELVDCRLPGVDMCIRYATTEHFEGLKAHLLFREELVPICSPRLLEGENGLREPADLACARLLYSPARTGLWQSWLSAAGAGDVPAEHGRRMPNDEAAIEAAAQGQGVALASRALVRSQVAEGRIVVLFDQGYCSDYGYYLLYPHSASRDERIIAFRDWLLESLQDPSWVRYTSGVVATSESMKEGAEQALVR